jgi:eukaryotic-like serine/threonine-protein kinase
MSKTLALGAIIISLTATILVTGIFVTTLSQMTLAQGNFTTPATISNSQNISPPNSTAATNATSANFLTYENSTWGIKIQYPSSWAKQTSGHGVTFAVLPNGTSSNNENNLQQFLAKLNLTSIAGIPTNAPLKALADRIVDSYRHFLHNFQIESYTNTTLAGNNGIKIVYSYTDPKNTNFKATDIATIKNNRLYVIQYYYAQSSTYQDVLQTLQKMVNSFQING